jgi:hypothetical protein
LISVPDVYLNGERIDLNTANHPHGHEVKTLFDEFAKGRNANRHSRSSFTDINIAGDEGAYPTLEDAVVLKTLLDAIERSYTEGKRITL